MNFWLHLLVMAGVTYLIRMIPFTLFRRQITSKFFRSFLHYIPYAVLCAMTVPAIFHATGSLPTAIAGTVVAVALALWEKPLIVVALAAALASFLTGLVM